MKSLKLIAVVLGGILLLSSCSNTDEWITLFDGETFDGWRGYGLETFPDSGWTIEDGCLKCLHSGTGEAGAGGDVLYDKQFTNFHLKLEWMIEEGGNSGIFYLGQELADEGKKIWYTAPEYQILDNFSSHIDNTLGKDGNRRAGTLYDLIPANPQAFERVLRMIRFRYSSRTGSSPSELLKSI